MTLGLLACLFVLTLAAPAGATDLKGLLPPGATVSVTWEGDLTGDGRPELIVGYTLPRKGLPPTAGWAVVLEQDPAGGFRRFDLPGGWSGHYLPRFAAVDLTGDGRPELVEQVAGGGAWGYLRVFRRAADAYEMLLQDAAQDHVLWDADGDGVPEVIARHRTGSQADQVLQRYIWREGRFIAWHAPSWSYTDLPAKEADLPDLTGLTVGQASEAANKAGLTLGAIAQLDGPGEAGRIIRHGRDGDQVHVAIGAGDTRVTVPAVPPVAAVYYDSGTVRGIAPIAPTEAQRTRWRNWLQQVAGGAQQAVWTGGLYSGRDPVHYVELREPWSVTLGGRPQQVRWVGVGTGVPYRGLLFLAAERRRDGYNRPKFTAALYSTGALPPAPIPAEQPLDAYLKRNPETDAFVTTRPEE